MTAPGQWSYPPPFPPAPPPGPPSKPKRGCLFKLVVISAAAIVMIMALFILLVIVVRATDKAPEVPPDFKPPTTLPVSSTTIDVGMLAFDSDRTGNFELYVMEADGSGVRALTNDAIYDSWWPRISPDRRTILFVRTPKGVHDRDYSQTSVWAVGADGTNLVELRPRGLDNWIQQGHPEWSPDGQQLLLFGGNRTSPQIFVTDRQGQNPRAVTDRPGSNLDPAYSPDGTQVYFVGCAGAICTGGAQEIYRVSVNGGEPVRLTQDELRDQDPYPSPDGKQLAWLTQVEGGLIGEWDVQIGDADARNPRLLAGDKGITSRAVWSADSKTVYVHRIPPGGTTFQIYAADAAGGPLRELTAGQPGSNEYPAT